jgi:toluene monooxygenase system protein D
MALGLQALPPKQGGTTMTGEIAEVYDRVGPVLQSGTVANAIVAAIKDLNQDVLVVDRGAYVRVLVPKCCVVTRSAIEKHLGRPFRFPGELETVMSAFKGSLQLNQDDAAWRFGRPGTAI